MPKRQTNLIRKLILISALLIAPNASAGIAGKIAGRVIEKSTGEPLPGVNVIIVGSNRGSATDLEGNFSIVNVRPGTYAVKASFIGYKEVLVRNVKVSIDLTTEVNFELEETVLDIGETVEVIAERPMVQKDLTASTSIVDADLIEALPVTEVNDVLELQAGVSDGHVRGGRLGEVAYWIDGVPVTDVYDGSTVVNLNTSTVQELQLVSGAFNAEFGQAMSGIVNIVTKDGSNDFHGSFTGYLGDFISSDDEEPDPRASTPTTLFDGIEEINPTDIYSTEFTITGPIIKDRMHFNSNIRYLFNEGHLYGRRIYTPQNITDNRDPEQQNWVISLNPESGRGDSSLVPMSKSQKLTLQNKISFKITPTMRASYNLILDREEFKEFDFAWKFNPDGIPTRFRNGTTHLFNLNHAISANTFYQFGATYFNKNFKQYVYENPNDPRYTHPRLLGQNPSESFLTGGTNLQHFERETKTFLGKLDITSQVTKTHQVKAGIEVRRHNIFFNDVNLVLTPLDAVRDPILDGNPFITPVIAPDTTSATNRYTQKPYELSAYIQDKMEFQDLIVNAGVRIDYFQPDGVILSDPSDPNLFDPRRPENKFEDANENGIQEVGERTLTAADRRSYWFKDAEAKWQVSPRLGLAFPVTDRGVFHFSFGLFFQIPSFELLYRNPEFELGVGTGNLGVVGNADLRPQKTVNGEVGLQQQLTDDISIDITGYFRDIRDLAGTRVDEIRLFGAGTYSQFSNSDFGFVRGIVISLEKRLRDNFGATIDYTLQDARGNSSDPTETRNAIAGGREPEVRLVPLDWDRPHKLNATATYSDPGNFGVSLIAKFQSGRPFTPRQSADIGILLTRSERMPSNFTADLRAFKNFSVGRLNLSLFARVFNLFDTRNQINVYDDTGRADFTLDERDAALRNPPQLVNSIRQFFRNPTFYSEPRRVEMGLTIEY